MSEWISVNERLPSINTEIKYSLYLAIHKDWDHQCRILMFDNEESAFTRDGGDVQKITHWMPLPEAPK